VHRFLRPARVLALRGAHPSHLVGLVVQVGASRGPDLAPLWGVVSNRDGGVPDWDGGSNAVLADG